MTSSITSNQERTLQRFAEDAARSGVEIALRNRPLDKAALQRLLANGKEFRHSIIDTVVASIPDLSALVRFGNEEIESYYGYPNLYRRESIENQIERIAKLFNLKPQAAYRYAKHLPELPLSAEGWFATARWDSVAEVYGEAVEQALQLLRDHRVFSETFSSDPDPSYLKESTRTIRMMRRIQQEQPGGILIIPAQFGLLHRGRSPRRARECFKTGEFGLGLFTTVCMALVHPTRFRCWQELEVYCVGDAIAPHRDGCFSHVPALHYDDGLRLCARACDTQDEFYGSASAFFPK